MQQKLAFEFCPPGYRKNCQPQLKSGMTTFKVNSILKKLFQAYAVLKYFRKWTAHPLLKVTQVYISKWSGAPNVEISCHVCNVPHESTAKTFM